MGWLWGIQLKGKMLLHRANRLSSRTLDVPQLQVKPLRPHKSFAAREGGCPVRTQMLMHSFPRDHAHLCPGEPWSLANLVGKRVQERNHIMLLRYMSNSLTSDGAPKCVSPMHADRQACDANQEDSGACDGDG